MIAMLNNMTRFFINISKQITKRIIDPKNNNNGFILVSDFFVISVIFGLGVMYLIGYSFLLFFSFDLMIDLLGIIGFIN